MGNIGLMLERYAQVKDDYVSNIFFNKDGGIDPMINVTLLIILIGMILVLAGSENENIKVLLAGSVMLFILIAVHIWGDMNYDPQETEAHKEYMHFKENVEKESEVKYVTSDVTVFEKGAGENLIQFAELKVDEGSETFRKEIDYKLESAKCKKDVIAEIDSDVYLCTDEVD